MKAFIYILVIFLASCSVINKIPDDVKHHYAAAGVAVGTGMISYKITKRPFVSGLIGFGAGWAVTDIKENWYDGKLGRGVKSNIDKADGRWGAGCGGFYIFSGYTIRESKQEIDTTYFKNLK